MSPAAPVVTLGRYQLPPLATAPSDRHQQHKVALPMRSLVATHKAADAFSLVLQRRLNPWQPLMQCNAGLAVKTCEPFAVKIDKTRFELDSITNCLHMRPNKVALLLVVILQTPASAIGSTYPDLRLLTTPPPSRARAPSRTRSLGAKLPPEIYVRLVQSALAYSDSAAQTASASAGVRPCELASSTLQSAIAHGGQLAYRG